MKTSRTIANRFVIADPERDLLGRGGMGDVYRATDTHTGETVAVKALSPDVLVRDPDLLERFLREGEALRRLNHPNIVHMITACEGADRHYLVMEYVGGGSLQQLLDAEGRLPLQRTIEIGLDLADALTRAHRLGIIHRDLKPANVLLADDGAPRLADFGLAHLAAASQLTRSGMLMGTVDYLSPEACQGDALDERADIWAFGVMLFQMLAGQTPFRGDNLTARLTAILMQPTPDLAALVPDLPDGLLDLIYRMLEKDRQQRIPSVRQVGLELEALLKGRESARQGGPFEPPAPPAVGPRHNLPAQTTPFVGRQAELAELARLLADPSVRLVSIVGAGGMGKTRLALEAAAAQPGSFPDGVWFVALAPLLSVEALVPTAAAAIGYKFREAGEPRQQLLEHLSQKELLLILDNFEHLLDGVGLTGDVLTAAPKVKILTTSRVRLNLQGEQLLHLGGMHFPAEGSFEDAAGYSSVRLFLQSARRVRPGFELGPDDLRQVARVCRLVGGMPLGILLAAGWAGMLTTAEIATEISQSLDFLETGLHDVPERQRSMRAVFARTWSLQSPREQEVFRGLSVFRGGFTREAAQQVTGATLRELMGLTDKSLIQRDSTGRYGIHELLRQYAEEQLGNRGEAELIHAQHLAYLLSVAGPSGEVSGQPPQKDWLQRMWAERDNLRAAMNWSLNGGDAQMGLRLAVRLRWFWTTSLPLPEGRDWLRRFLAAVPEPSVLRVRALEMLGQTAVNQGEFSLAQSLLEESLALAEALGDRLGIATASFKLSWPAEEAGDLARARSLLARSLSLSQELNHPKLGAFILFSMADLAHLEGDLVRARDLYEQVIDLHRELGLISLRAVLADTSLVLIHFGDLDRCDALLKESLSLYSEAGRVEGQVFEAFAYLANSKGQPTRAVRLLGVAETLFRASGRRIETYYRHDHEANVESLYRQLGKAAFEAALAEGGALTVEQAIALALDDHPVSVGDQDDKRPDSDR